MIKYKRKKSATFEDAPIKKKHQTLQNEIEIFISLLKIDEPLFITFNNNTSWLNLTDMNISHNDIDLLPRKLGTIHCLRRLDVSHNCLKWRFGGSWLKEARIKRTLRFLDISNNSLFELSEYIWNLTALEELNISHNFLGYLPQGIEKLRNLRTLDLSHNLLKYLPVEIIILELQTIDISMNPLISDIEEDWVEIVLPSLSQFAAKALYQYCKDTHVIFQYDKMNEFINRNIINNCSLCGDICSVPYFYGAISTNYLPSIAANVISHTVEISTVWLEYCRCVRSCRHKIRNLESNRID